MERKSKGLRKRHQEILGNLEEAMHILRKAIKEDEAEIKRLKEKMKKDEGSQE